MPEELKLIGDYIVTEVIRSGGMSDIYKAYHKDVPEDIVIIKFVKDPGLEDLIVSEARKIASLKNVQTICSYKGLIKHENRRGIIMEYIDGDSLAEKMESIGIISIEDATRIICDVLRGLEECHNHKIYHCDIKPQNIIIDNNLKHAKIIDFGIAKATFERAAKSGQLTKYGRTPEYCPPEQFRPSDDIDYAKVDIYAVGMMLYEMLCGRLPFKGKEYEIYEAKSNQEPDAPHIYNRNIPDYLNKIILKAISRDPGNRFDRAMDMRTSIENKKLEPPPKTVTDPYKPPQPPRPNPIRNGKRTGKWLIPLVIIVLILLVCIMIYIYNIHSIRKTEFHPSIKLNTPANNSSIELDESILFSWQFTNITGGITLLLINDTLNYKVQSLTNDNDSIYTGRFIQHDSMPNGEYFWQIVHISNDYHDTVTSEIFHFLINRPFMYELMLISNIYCDYYINDSIFCQEEQTCKCKLTKGHYLLSVVPNSVELGTKRYDFDLLGDTTIMSIFSLAHEEPSLQVFPEDIARQELSQAERRIDFNHILQRYCTPFSRFKGADAFCHDVQQRLNEYNSRDSVIYKNAIGWLRGHGNANQGIKYLRNYLSEYPDGNYRDSAQYLLDSLGNIGIR